MRVVLDAGVPHKLRHQLPGHHVVRSHYVGLDQLDDALLLDAIDGHYDVLVTCHQGVPWQQQFGRRQVAVIVMVARSNDIGDLLQLMPTLLLAIDDVLPGEVREIR